MRNFNFLSKSSSQSCVHRVVTLALTVGSPSAHRRSTMLKLISILVLILTIGVGNVWGTDVTDNITATDLAATGTTYADFSNVSKTSDAKYAGNSAKDNSGNIQLRSKNSNSGIVSTASGGTVKSVKITVGSGSNTVDVYGSNTAYTAASDLYNNSKQGTKVGSVTATGTISFSDDYAYVGIRSNSGAIYLSSVEITWTAGAASPSITTSVSSLSEVGYSTTDFTQQVKSFTVSGSSLTADVTVTAPTGYEVCKTENGTYTSSVTFDKGSGTLSAQTVYVRLASGKVAGSYSGNVTCTSTGATTKNVAVSGSVPFTVTWKANGTTHATTYVTYAIGTGTAIGTLPTAPDPSDYTCSPKAFYGWYDGASYSNASVAPTIISTSTKITTDKTFSAVFADESATNNYTRISQESALVAGAKYLIVGNSSTTYKALPVDKASTLTVVTPSNGTTISNPATDLIWTLEGAADAWKIKSTSNNKYLQISSGSLSFVNSTTLTFSVNVSSSKFTFTSSASSGNKILSYYHSGNCFNAFSSANTVYVYKQVISTSNYRTSCCQPLGSINGSFS